MSIAEGLAGYHNIFGLRGVLAISSYRLCGFPKTLKADFPTLKAPVTLRVRTTDTSVFSEIIMREEYGNFELPFIPKTIVDAGANIGMASIYYALKYPQARIVAIEAEASNFAMLCRNTRPYRNIMTLHAALWGHNGTIGVNKPDPSTGAFGKWGFVTKEGSGSQVQAVTIPQLMTIMGLDRIDLLKMDIEGAEKEVFESCDWAQSVRSVVVELHDRFKPGCSEAVNRALQGFSQSTRGELTFYVRLLDGTLTAAQDSHGISSRAG